MPDEPFPSEGDVFDAIVMFSAHWSSAKVLGSLARRVGLDLSDVDTRMLFTVQRPGPDEGARPGWLAAELGMSRPTTSKSLARLVNRNLVERTPSACDGRATTVRLTVSGAAAHEQLMNEGLRLVSSALAGIENAHRRAITLLLTRLSTASPE